MDATDGNSLGALFYYTNVVYSVSVIGSDVDLADVARRLKLMCRKPLLFICLFVCLFYLVLKHSYQGLVKNLDGNEIKKYININIVKVYSSRCCLLHKR